MSTGNILFNRIALIGVGMIGGSFVLSMKNAGIVNTIVGVDITEAELNIALDLGVIDEISPITALSNKNIDAVVIATPVGVMTDIFAQLKFNNMENILITDVGSTKQSVIDAAEKGFGFLPPTFVPSHPIAGREHVGVRHAESDMFDGFKAIVTPHDNSHEVSINQVVAMWEACGASVSIMNAKKHDKILAATSHLPHVLAYTLVESLSNAQEKEDILDYAAGGFKSFSRTASSNPIIWRDICLNNKEDILLWLDSYQEKLSSMREMIEKGNSDAIERIFKKAKNLRDERFG